MHEVHTETESELPVAGITIGSLIALVILLVAAVVLIIRFKQNRCTRKRIESARKNHDISLCNLYKDGSGTKEHISRGNTKFRDLLADIVILHLENDTQEVESFKSHLEKLSKEMEYSDIIIKLFEEVFSTEQFSRDVEIQTMLKVCLYVFVYISKDSDTHNLKRFGLNERSINNALEKQETNKYIKIVSNCGHWDLPNGQLLSVKRDSVFLDYFLYNKQPPDDIMNDNYRRNFKDILQTCIASS
ncbi:unnamed protein product [Mytilus coruscus]|uniref:Uncharacterized protein n=1 Tax=Mytilus coruscus TaxID=42192 RepID=A0A6J8EB97_MYTCO|nr:unnamed protein product [Mytilus coruscus]